MRNQVLDYYLHDGPTAFRFQLAGTINDEGVRRLEQVWRTTCSLIGDRRRIIDITFVTGVDEQGRASLAGWHRAGAELVANSIASRTLAESILGTALPEPPVNARAWSPVRAALFRSAASMPLLLTSLLLTFAANAANLKSETVAAWDGDLETAKANLLERIRPGGCFLWTLENPDRAARVRAGEIVVAPAPGPNPKKVPGGLIHHWVGAMFLPDFTIEQVLEVTRDYDRYTDYYQPSVLESKTIAHDDANDRFSMQIMNKAFFLKTAMDADYQATYVRLDAKRVYSISRTTRLQEIEEYGQVGEHRVPEGEGSGYIWKLFSIARFEQREAGVFVELEAIALSREIPVAARFFVDPIVRRVSRNSLLISLRQTQEALRGNAALTARRARIPAGAGRVQSLLAK
jgi:hypothetical protein